MAKNTNLQGAAKDCEERLAQIIDGKFFIPENYFREQKLKLKNEKFGEFEEAVKKARATFASSRGTPASAQRAGRELSAIEEGFVKWYESDEDFDDAPLFGFVVSCFREAKEKLSVYRVATECLATGSKEACMGLFARAFQKYKAAAEKACSIAKNGDERMADNADTIMRYIDLDHEALLVEMMAPSGSKDNFADRAISRMGGRHASLMSMSSHAYHAQVATLQKAAAELLAASYEYQGALCAAYVFAEQGDR